MQHKTPLRTMSRVMLTCTLVALGCGEDATGPDPDVSAGPVSISVVSSIDMVMAIGKSAQMTATVTDADGVVLAGANLSWRSSNDQVATVTGTGLVTAADAGQVTITATHDGIDGSVSLTVIDANLEEIAELRNDPLMHLLVDRLSENLAQQLTAAFNELDDAVTTGNCLAVHRALQTALSDTSGSPDPSDVITLAVIGLVLERANSLLGMN